MVLSLRQHVKAYQQHLVEMQQQYHKLSEASDATMHEHTLLKRQVAQLSEKSAALMAEFKVQAEQVVAQRAHLQQWEAELRCDDDDDGDDEEGDMCLVTMPCSQPFQYIRQQEEVLRATKSSGSKKKQAKLQRALALATGSTTNADADLLLTRFKSLIQNAQTLATTAAPSNPPSTQHMMHASTISSNTMRREGSNVSVGRRGSHSSTELLLQQVVVVVGTHSDNVLLLCLKRMGGIVAGVVGLWVVIGIHVCFFFVCVQLYTSSNPHRCCMVCRTNAPTMPHQMPIKTHQRVQWLRLHHY